MERKTIVLYAVTMQCEFMLVIGFLLGIALVGVLEETLQ